MAQAPGVEEAAEAVSGFFFAEHLDYAAEYWEPDTCWGSDGLVGMWWEGEHDWEPLIPELGGRVVSFLEMENPPYPGWAP